MTELAKKDNQLGLLHKLSNELEALTSSKICELPPLEVDKVLMTAVHKAYNDKGQSVDPEAMEYIVENLLTSTLKACPYIRIAEIPIAIEKGILGDYGDYFGLNVITFVGFIKSHYGSLNRANLAKRLPKTEEENPVKSESEILDQDKKLLVSAFETYKRIGFYEDHGNYIYRVAVKKLELFVLTSDKQKEYLNLGKSRAIEKLKNEMVQKPFDRKPITEQITQATNLEPKTEGVKRVYKESLQLALMDWFKGLVEMEIEITDLLNEK